jgi:transcriptional regulator with XRE-family HTH domain
MKNKEMHELFGLSNQNISDWENGKSGDGKQRLLKVLRIMSYDNVKAFLESEEKFIENWKE